MRETWCEQLSKGPLKMNKPPEKKKRIQEYNNIGTVSVIPDHGAMFTRDLSMANMCSRYEAFAINLAMRAMVIM